MKRTVILLVVWFFVVPAVAAERVAIFVGSDGRDGFEDVDRGVLDSIKDIQNEFKGAAKKQFRLVKQRGDAAVVVLVRSRRTAAGNAAIAVPIGGAVFAAGIERRQVDALLIVGDYSKPITGSADAWGECAEQIMKDVRAWVQANQKRLR